MLLGVTSSLISSSANLSKLTDGFKGDLFFGFAIALAASGLVAVATFIVKRLQERNASTDGLRASIEHAYFAALNKSSLNPSEHERLNARYSS
jgi:hypothetical protein